MNETRHRRLKRFLLIAAAAALVASVAINIAMVRRLRDHQTRVVILTIFPPASVPPPRRIIWSDRAFAAIARVNEHLRKPRPGVTVIDCDPLFLRDGRMKSEYALDFLHVNPAGYAALNDLLRPELESILRETP